MKGKKDLGFYGAFIDNKYVINVLLICTCEKI